MPEPTLIARGALHVVVGRYGRDLQTPGLQIQVLRPRTIVHIIARRNRYGELASVLTSRFGMALPVEPMLAHGDRMSFLWAGHLQWLALAAEDAGPDLKAELHNLLAGSASLSDQSDSRFAVALAGAHARDVLAKLTPVDLHQRVFRSSQTALTLFGHVTGQITQIDEAPSYEIMVFRSFAESLWHSIQAAGAEFGIQVTETTR